MKIVIPLFFTMALTAQAVGQDLLPLPPIPTVPPIFASPVAPHEHVSIVPPESYSETIGGFRIEMSQDGFRYSVEQSDEWVEGSGPASVGAALSRVREKQGMRDIGFMRTLDKLDVAPHAVLLPFPYRPMPHRCSPYCRPGHCLCGGVPGICRCGR